MAETLPVALDLVTLLRLCLPDDHWCPLATRVGKHTRLRGHLFYSASFKPPSLPLSTHAATEDKRQSAPNCQLLRGSRDTCLPGLRQPVDDVDHIWERVEESIVEGFCDVFGKFC